MAFALPASVGLRLCLAPSPTPASAASSASLQALTSARVGDVAEVSPASGILAREIACEIGEHGGGWCLTSVTVGLCLWHCDRVTVTVTVPVPCDCACDCDCDSDCFAVRYFLDVLSTAALVIDYGRETSIGASVRGIRDHKFVDFLSDPGAVDLVRCCHRLPRCLSDECWPMSSLTPARAVGRCGLHILAAVRRRLWAQCGTMHWTTSARSPTLLRARRHDADVRVPAVAQTHGPVTQSTFLQRLGIVHRLEALLDVVDDEAVAERLVSEAQRLVDPAQMGTTYKAMCITPRGAPVPLGFQDDEPAQQ